MSLCYNRLHNLQYKGGYTDVWMGDHQGRWVAAKVLRVYSTSDFDKIRRVCRLYIISSVQIGQLITTHPEILQRSDEVEGPQSSERVAATGGDDGQGPIRHGVGVDGKWERQRNYKVSSGR